MASDHKHGEMDTEVQEKTFEGFVKSTTYFCISVFVILVFLAVVNG